METMAVGLEFVDFNSLSAGVAHFEEEKNTFWTVIQKIYYNSRVRYPQEYNENIQMIHEVRKHIVCLSAWR